MNCKQPSRTGNTKPKNYAPLINKERRARKKALKEKEEAQQKIIDLAKMLKDMGIPTEQIIEKTGLSKEEIEKL